MSTRTVEPAEETGKVETTEQSGKPEQTGATDEDEEKLSFVQGSLFYFVKTTVETIRFAIETNDRKSSC